MNSDLKQISFHDPDGCLYQKGERLFRRVSLSTGLRIKDFLQSDLGIALTQERVLPLTQEISPHQLKMEGIGESDPQYLWFEHASVRFISYPYEWTPEMLIDAGLFTLALTARLNAHGWDLKDASAYNILFDGVRPVFVDLCSIVESTNEPYWWPKGQFERHFINPLIAYIYSYLEPHKIHFAEKDGLSSLKLGRVLGIKAWTTILGFQYGGIHLVIQRMKTLIQLPKLVVLSKDNAAQAKRFQMISLMKTINTIRKKVPRPKSEWSLYEDKRKHYSDDSLVHKKESIRRWLNQIKPSCVLDLGSNTGEFSSLACSSGSSVIAVENDLDAARIGYIQAQIKQLDHLSSVIDFSYPSPAMGWIGQERKSFHERTSKKIDCILALAILHHWLINARIPFEGIINQLRDQTTRYLIIEYIDPSDSMFIALMNQQNKSYEWFSLIYFKSVLEKHFIIIEEAHLADAKRDLFLCELRVKNELNEAHDK